MVRNCHSEALRAVLILTCTGQRTGLARRYGSLSGLEPIRFSEATAPAILRQKSLQYPYIAAHFSLVYPKHLLTENCAHPPPKEFLTDFGDARRRKVRTFQGERRQKTRKFIGEGLVGSSPLRLPLFRLFFGWVRLRSFLPKISAFFVKNAPKTLFCRAVFVEKGACARRFLNF